MILKSIINQLYKHAFILIDNLLPFGKNVTIDVVYSIIPYLIIIIVEYPGLYLFERKSIIRSSVKKAMNKFIQLNKQSKLYRGINEDVIEWVNSSDFIYILDNLFEKVVIEKKYKIVNIDLKYFNLNNDKMDHDIIKSINLKLKSLNKFINNDKLNEDLNNIITIYKYTKISPFDMLELEYKKKRKNIMDAYIEFRDNINKFIEKFKII